MDDTNYQATANAVVWPVIAGNCAILIFTGVLLTVFGNFLGSSGWARSSKVLKTTLVVVTLLALVSAGLAIHDILYFSTILSTDLGVYELGTSPQAFEPMLAGLIATICQVVLTLRASFIIRSPVIRWIYICVLLSGSLIGLLGAIAMAGLSYAYHVGDYYAQVGILSLTNCISLWMWASAATDLSISLSYLWLLRRKLSGGNEVTVSVVRMIGRIILQSALYTAVLACTAAILTSALSSTDPNYYDIPYSFWEPLSILYPLSLFSTLGIADRVVNKMSDFPAAGSGSTRAPSTTGSHLLPPPARLSCNRMSGNKISGDMGSGEKGLGEKVTFVPLESPTKGLNGRRGSYMGVTVSIEEERIEEHIGDPDIELGRSRSHLSQITSGAFDEFPRLD